MRFVLVHGAWHDERSWYPVAGLLRDAGHEVITPTLTGLGVRADELSPEVGLDTHVRDLAAHLDRFGDEAVLVAHSYGAVVARAAAGATTTRIRRLVLVEGWTPADGQSMADIAPDWFMPAMRRSAERDGEGWRIPPPPAAMLGVEDDDLAARLAELMSDHPLRTFTDATSTTPAVEAIPHTAVLGNPGMVPFDQWAAAHGWPVLTLDAGHDSPLIAPHELTELILQASAA
jgi:pimeloyl-ACP methyl ester carboxylesterase